MKTMPKAISKKRRQTPTKRVWQQEDVNELLACLDYCVGNGFNFDRIIIGHLKKATGKDFNERQISDRLLREYKNYGREGSTTVEDLKSEGSKVLEGYSEDDREDIREAVNRIAIAGNRYRLRSTPSDLLSRSRTVSRPRQLTESSSITSRRTPNRENLRNVQVDVVEDSGEDGEEMVRIV